MTKTEKASLDAYFAEGDSWARDREDRARKTLRLAWIIAGAATTVAVCEAFALMALAPLKTVEPYTLMVDRQTGFVQALKPLDPQLIAGDTALTQSFLVQYVIAREGFDYSTLQGNYRKVALWSAGSARSTYLSSMQASNPDGPLTLYPRSAIIDVQVKSVTSMGRNSAMVRYDTRRIDAGGQVRPSQAWMALIRYAYSGAPMNVADRFVNPLGFQVQHYRRSVEMLAPAAAVTAPVFDRAVTAVDAAAPKQEGDSANRPGSMVHR